MNTTTNTNEMNVVATSFADFSAKLGYPYFSEGGVRRGEHLDRVFAKYELNNGSVTYTEHNGSVRVVTLPEFALKTANASHVPAGNGEVDKTIRKVPVGTKEGKPRELPEKIKYLQTALQYRNSAIAEVELQDDEKIKLFEVLTQILIKDKLTKELMDELVTIRSSLLPADKETVYLTIARSEKTNAKLEELGFVFGDKSHWIDKNTGQHQYCATISQGNMRDHNKEISTYIEIIGKPIPRLNDDFETEALTITFSLKDQE